MKCTMKDEKENQDEEVTFDIDEDLESDFWESDEEENEEDDL